MSDNVKPGDNLKEQGERTGLQDRGAALGMVFLFLGAIFFAWLYDFGPKMNLVMAFAAFFTTWRLILAFRHR